METNNEIANNQKISDEVMNQMDKDMDEYEDREDVGIEDLDLQIIIVAWENKYSNSIME